MYSTGQAPHLCVPENEVECFATEPNTRFWQHLFLQLTVRGYIIFKHNLAFKRLKSTGVVHCDLVCFDWIRERVVFIFVYKHRKNFGQAKRAAENTAQHLVAIDTPGSQAIFFTCCASDYIVHKRFNIRRVQMRRAAGQLSVSRNQRN